VKEKRLAKVTGALVAALLAFGCGTSHSTTPSAVATVNGEGPASKLDNPVTLSPSLEFDVLTINRSGVPVRLTVDGRVTYQGVRAGTAVVIIGLPEAFGALAVGHTYRLVEVR